LITGAASGIGEAFVYWYADNGNDLVLVGRNKSELDRVAFEVRSRALRDGFTDATERAKHLWKFASVLA
jgi:short-subunit dehydrogenase